MRQVDKWELRLLIAAIVIVLVLVIALLIDPEALTKPFL